MGRPVAALSRLVGGRMRVALYHNLPPGGAMRTVREFVTHTRDRLECDVFTLDFGAADPFAAGDPEFERRDVSPVVRQFRHRVHEGRWHRGYHRLRTIDQLARVRAAERAVAEQINAGDYDVAYVHPCWFGQSPSILGDLRLPTVYFMQERRRASFEPGYSDRVSPRRQPVWLVAEATERVLRRRDARAAHSADLVLANSRYSAGTIRDAYGIDPVVTHLGVDVDRFRPATGPGADPTVLSVGGLEAFKGHHLTVAALARIPVERRPELGLVYERAVPSYRDELLAAAASGGVVVHEYPGVTDAQLAELYSGAVATVLAAQLEPLGLVVLESLACGTPVVAADEGGYLETLTPGVNGYHVSRTPEGLARGLEKVLAGELETSRPALRESILPYWTTESSVGRQEDRLRQVARTPGRPQVRTSP